MGLQAALTSEEAAGKEKKYSERASATMTVTAKMLGRDCCCLLLLLWQRERLRHKRTDIETRKEARGRKYSELYVVYVYQAPLCAFNLLILIIIALCNVQGEGAEGRFCLFSST